MASIRIVNWGRFQHYKNRNPPWLKLHRALLDNREWAALSGDASKLLAECWLLASEYDAGTIPMSTRDLAWRLRRPNETHLARLLQELAAHGFVELVDHDASTVLADCKQAATPEAETETETETDTSPIGEDAVGVGDEVIDAEVEILSDELAIEPAPDEPRPSNVLALRPSDPVPTFGNADADEPVNGGQIMAAWIQWKRPSLSRHDRSRMAGVAARIADGRTMGEVRLAMVGMDCIWPFAPPSVVKGSEGRPWDLMDLEKCFNKAMAGAGNHPVIRKAREDAEWEAQFANREAS